MGEVSSHMHSHQRLPQILMGAIGFLFFAFPAAISALRHVFRARIYKNGAQNTVGCTLILREWCSDRRRWAAGGIPRPIKKEVSCIAVAM